MNAKVYMFSLGIEQIAIYSKYENDDTDCRQDQITLYNRRYPDDYIRCQSNKNQNPEFILFEIDIFNKHPIYIVKVTNLVVLLLASLLTT